MSRWQDIIDGGSSTAGAGNINGGTAGKAAKGSGIKDDIDSLINNPVTGGKYVPPVVEQPSWWTTQRIVGVVAIVVIAGFAWWWYKYKK